MTFAVSSLLVGWLLWQGSSDGRRRRGRCTVQQSPSSSLESEESSSSAVFHPPLSSCSICVLQPSGDNPHLSSVSQRLSQELALPTFTLPELEQQSSLLLPLPYAYALVVHPLDEDYAIGIQALQAKGKKRQRLELQGTPWYVDYYWTNQHRRGDDLLRQAVGNVQQKRVVDLTAGWGQDAWLLAQAGAAHVTLVERNPVVATLLNDALRRAADAAVQMSVRVGDGVDVAQDIMRHEQTTVDLVYLDPMFPVRKKSAAVKKNMQILHALLGSQEIVNNEQARLAQEAVLLQRALDLARQRVVVKRPIHAPSLGGDNTPSYQVRGSINRWDVYIKNAVE